jgi:hypothetical protein
MPDQSNNARSWHCTLVQPDQCLSILDLTALRENNLNPSYGKIDGFQQASAEAATAVALPAASQTTLQLQVE